MGRVTVYKKAISLFLKKLHLGQGMSLNLHKRETPGITIKRR